MIRHFLFALASMATISKYKTFRSVEPFLPCLLTMVTYSHHPIPILVLF